MKNIVLFTFIFLLFLTGCSQEKKRTLNISTNSWIGYAPLFYAKEKGYLSKLHINLITNVSLAEAADIYDVGKADMVTTTQHEYYSLKESGHNIVPIILFDRSKGGDMILSNRTIQELKNSKKIYAYLEIDSINTEVLEDFIKHYHLDKKRFNFINQDQAQMQDLKPLKNKDIVVVTYVPYNIALEKKGFHEIASTRNMDAIIVIDSLCTNTELIKHDKKRLKALKHIIDKSINAIQKDKKAAYKLVKPYLGNISYKEYLHSLQLIQWINKPSQKLLKRIEPMQYNKKDLI